MAGGGNSSAATEGAIMGAVLLMTLWGALIVVADLVFGANIVPEAQAGAVAILAALAVVGALIGAAVGKRTG